MQSDGIPQILLMCVSVFLLIIPSGSVTNRIVAAFKSHILTISISSSLQFESLSNSFVVMLLAICLRKFFEVFYYYIWPIGLYSTDSMYGKVPEHWNIFMF